MVIPATNRPGTYERTLEHRLLMSWRKMGHKPTRWHGGQYSHRGYVFVYKPNHPQAHRGYVKRAILILEEKLGRLLYSGMDSHHINGIRDDDRPENLEEREHKEHAILNLNRLGRIRK